MRYLICLILLCIPSLGLAEFNLFQSGSQAEQISPNQQRLENAYLYMLGSQGEARDSFKTLEALQAAAAGGHAGAQTVLGMLYKQGRFVKGDGVQAQYWLEKGAAQGNSVAQYHLGVLLAEKATSNEDLLGSFVLWQQAKKGGHTLAERALKELDYRLTDEEKERAEELWAQVQAERARSQVAEGAQGSMPGQGQEEVEEDVGKISLQRVTAQWIRNRAAGNLFVIQGEAINKYDEPRAHLEAVGRLIGAQGQVLVEMSAFCGNPIKIDELAETDYAEILPIMQNVMGQQEVNRQVEPGGLLPFTIVFKDVPPNVTQYSVKGRSVPLTP